MSWVERIGAPWVADRIERAVVIVSAEENFILLSTLIDFWIEISVEVVLVLYKRSLVSETW